MRWCVVLLWPLLLVLGRSAQADAWQPPRPDSTAFDWVRLGIGEWLGGEIKGLRNETLEFDSDKLGVLQLDWDDVKELRSARIYTYVFAGRLVARGSSSVRDSVVVVSTPEGAQTYRRDQLISIVPAGGRELDAWSLDLHLGIVTRSGNTEQQDVNALVRVRRAGALTRLAVDYAGNFGRIDGIQNLNSHNGDARFDVYLAHRFYLTVPAINVFADEFQNIDLRITPSLGLGIRLLETRRVALDANLGGGYQWTRFRSVQPGEDAEVDQGAVIPRLTLETEPTADMDFDLSYELRIGVPDTQDSYHHLLGVWSLELTDLFDFEFTIAWDRVESPRADADGIVPKRDDFRTSFGLGIEL